MAEFFEYLKKIKPSGWLKGFLYGLLIIIIYQSALKQLVFHDWAWEDYSHCYLIPFVILYLIWEKREALATVVSSPSWIGMVPFVFGICLFWLGELSGEFFSMYISLWLVVVGLLWLHMGWKKIKVIAFTIFISLTMFPFPSFVTTKVLLALRLMSSQLGVAMLQMIGMSAYREGNVIDIGFTQLQVVDACSGLRYVLPLLVLSLILAYWYRAAFWKKAVLVISSIPLSIVVNSLRIAITGILYSAWGAEVAEGFFHGFSGWLIFLFAIPLLLLEMWFLQKVQGSRSKVQESTGVLTETAKDSWIPAAAGMTKGETGMTEKIPLSPPLKKEEGKIPPTPPLGKGEKWQGLLQPMFIVVVVILVMTFGLSHGIEFRQKVPISKPFSEFPMQVDEWQGARTAMEQKFIDVLDFSDYIIVDYTDRGGKTVNFYVAYYQDQRKGESIHSPETCLPGSGYEFKDAGDVIIPAFGGASPMKVNRAIMAKGNERELVFFWFPQRGRILTNIYQLKLYTFWDALTKQRTDGALVRVITPVMEGESISDAERRLQGFVREIVPVLDGYIPGK